MATRSLLNAMIYELLVIYFHTVTGVTSMFFVLHGGAVKL